MESPLRIGFVEAGSGFGGSAASLRLLLAALKEHPSRPECFVAGFGCAAFAPEGREIRARSLPGRFFSLRRWMRDAGVRRVHANNDPCDHLPTLLAARSLGLPVTFHLRSSRPLLRRERWMLRFAAGGVGVCRSALDRLASLPPEIRRSFRPLGDGVDLESFRVPPGQAASLRGSFGADDGDLVLLLPATLQPGKGQDTAIAAAARLSGSSPRLLWLLAGGEHYQSPGIALDLAARIREAGLEDRVRLLGHRCDLPALFAACDLALLPSRLTEGLPCAVLEALAAGKPVIAASSGGISEAVDEAVGRLVPPGDAEVLAETVRSLAVDPELRRRLGENARRRAEERYDIRRVAESLLALWGGEGL